jgi:hypothetical protein
VRPESALDGELQRFIHDSQIISLSETSLKTVIRLREPEILLLPVQNFPHSSLKKLECKVFAFIFSKSTEELFEAGAGRGETETCAFALQSDV